MRMSSFFTAVGGGWVRFLVPYVIAIVWILAFPEYNALGVTLSIMIIFSLSVELALGFGGINTLGQAAMFGAGAYAVGMSSVYLGIGDPLVLLVLAILAGMAMAAITGVFVLRGQELTVLAMSIVAGAICFELTNTFSSVTGGFDGLRGIRIHPLLGRFEFDLWGTTAFALSIGVALVAHVTVLVVTHSTFGVMMRGIKDNPDRMAALGAPLLGRRLMIFMIGGALAGLAGGLQTVTNEYVTNEAFGFYLSATVVVVMIIGGMARIYGAFVGAAAYLLLQDILSKNAPEYWFFWLGLILVLIVWFTPEGVIGLADRLRAAMRRKGGDT